MNNKHSVIDFLCQLSIENVFLVHLNAIYTLILRQRVRGQKTK